MPQHVYVLYCIYSTGCHFHVKVSPLARAVSPQSGEVIRSADLDEALEARTCMPRAESDFDRELNRDLAQSGPSPAIRSNI